VLVLHSLPWINEFGMFYFDLPHCYRHWSSRLLSGLFKSSCVCQTRTKIRSMLRNTASSLPRRKSYCQEPHPFHLFHHGQVAEQTLPRATSRPPEEHVLSVLWSSFFLSPSLYLFSWQEGTPAMVTYCVLNVIRSNFISLLLHSGTKGSRRTVLQGN